MPSYREVFVPEAAAKEFEDWLVSHDGWYSGVRRLPDEILTADENEVWAEHIRTANHHLKDFHLDHDDPHLNLRITAGMERLIQDAYKYKSIRPIKTVNIPLAVARIHSGFTESLPETPPDDISLMRRAEVLYFSSSRLIPFLPEDVKLTIQRYGLTGENAVFPQELAANYGVSVKRVRDHIGRALRRMPPYLDDLVSPVEETATDVFVVPPRS